jgi:hypothetical protein
VSMARALAFALSVAIAGCGGSFASGDATQAAANGALLGAGALASAGRAPTDHEPTYSEPGPELATPERDFVCTSGGDEQIVRARSREDALAECDFDARACTCVDRTMQDELGLYRH